MWHTVAGEQSHTADGMQVEAWTLRRSKSPLLGKTEEELWDHHRNVFLCACMGSQAVRSLLHGLQAVESKPSQASQTLELGLASHPQGFMNKHHVWPQSPVGLLQRRALQPSITTALTPVGTQASKPKVALMTKKKKKIVSPTNYPGVLRKAIFLQYCSSCFP